MLTVSLHPAYNSILTASRHPDSLSHTDWAFETNFFFLFFRSSVNKRLDEWVTEDYLDTRKVQFPRKDGSTTGHNTGVTTPKKLVPNSTGPLAANSSRPASPKSEADNELVNGNTVMAAALQKKMNRKRKVCKHQISVVGYSTETMLGSTIQFSFNVYLNWHAIHIIQKH